MRRLWRRLSKRNTDGDKADIKAGMVPQSWKDKPAKLAQKDRDARWTVKYSKAKQKPDGSKHAIDIAVPAFGFKACPRFERGTMSELTAGMD